jgi:hypothetical protein
VAKDFSVKKAAVREIITYTAAYNRIALAIPVNGPVIQPVPVIEGQRVGGKKQQQSHSYKRGRRLEIPDVCYDLFPGDEPGSRPTRLHCSLLH